MKRLFLVRRSRRGGRGHLSDWLRRRKVVGDNRDNYNSGHGHRRGIAGQGAD